MKSFLRIIFLIEKNLKTLHFEYQYSIDFYSAPIPVCVTTRLNTTATYIRIRTNTNMSSKRPEKKQYNNSNRWRGFRNQSYSFNLYTQNYIHMYRERQILLLVVSQMEVVHRQLPLLETSQFSSEISIQFLLLTRNISINVWGALVDRQYVLRYFGAPLKI